MTDDILLFEYTASAMESMLFDIFLNKKSRFESEPMLFLSSSIKMSAILFLFSVLLLCYSIFRFYKRSDDHYRHHHLYTTPLQI